MGEAASKLLVRLPLGLHGDLKEKARQQGTTLNDFCVAGLRRALENRSAPGEMLSRTVKVILESAMGELVQSVVLFGSRARGDHDAGSDTDLLLCVKDGVALTRDLYTMWDDLALKNPEVLGRSVSPHFSRLPEAPESAGSLWLEVAVDGIVYWDGSLSVSRFLGALRRYLLSGAVERRTSYGVPYWVRRDAESKAG
jgi:predicted nucleotidyltransferase